MRSKVIRILILAVTVLVVSTRVSYAQDGPTAGELQVMVDTLWVMIAGFLVFFMNAGFGLVETGFCRAKNTVNIFAKNFTVFAISSIAFFVMGFALMFGDGNSVLGTSGFLLIGADNSPAMDNYEGIFNSISWAGVPLYAKFFFQLVFAGTAATIVSGAVAERIKFGAFLLFSFILVAICYPITGHWIWGGGWLAEFGFLDFAGSTVVHSVGGWAALVGAIVLGPRLGKYKKDGSVRPLPGHSIALATLGGLILWLGWFGFNPGSTMAADAGGISHIALTTNLAAAAGIMAATCVSWVVSGKPDQSMIVNGALAGLVAITCPCAWVTPVSAIVIGAIAGTIVVFAVIGFDKLKVDDPVGAISVHLVCGIWGTLSLGLFAQNEVGVGGAGDGLFFGGGFSLLGAQIVGVLAVGAFTVVATFIAWKVLGAFMGGIRVSAEDEMIGLDISEMGMEAYPGDAVAGWDSSTLLKEMGKQPEEEEKGE